MKICSKCCLEKDDGCFYIGKLQCKACIKEIREQYYILNKKDIIEYKKDFYQENKSEIVEYKKEYYYSNKKTVRATQNKYKNKRRKIDPSFKLREAVSRAVHSVLAGSKNSSILDYLSYEIDELKIHLEIQFVSWMNWNNWGIYNPQTWDDSDPTTWTWQIDHIIPQSKLLYSSMEDDNFKKCWALDNLRPLSAKQNVLENSRR
jgi:hypothetical protein